jgi:hypothetical protein
MTTRRPTNPVLFVNIGWADRYDGTEWIRGAHSFLEEHGDDCSESRAFLADDDGTYWCGIGHGVVPADRIDIVFTAIRPADRTRRVVLLYRDAEPCSHKPGDTWQNAAARRAYLFRANDRPLVTYWPGHMNMRRWALEPSADKPKHPPLLALYQRVLAKAETDRLSRPLPPLSGDEDEELAAFEGEARRRFVWHRERERELRAAKIREAQRSRRGLVCELKGCGFDFAATYGQVCDGFAHVHHKRPLARLTRATKTKLSDLAIVCANCHAMIHRGGQCRPLEGLRVKRGR